MATREIEELEQELLRSARLLDVPSDEGRRAARTLSALAGAGAAAAGGLLGAGGADGAPRMAGARFATAGRAWVVGGLGIAAVAGVLAAGMLRPGAPTPAPRPASEAPMANTTPEATAAISQVVPSPPIPEPLVAPKAPAAAKKSTASAAVARPVGSAPPAVRGTSLAEQIAALDAVRASLATGRAGDALRMLDDFDRRFPAGPLSQESTAARVEALLDAGRTAEARGLAERFLADHPSSTHAPRMRALLESSPTAAPNTPK